MTAKVPQKTPRNQTQLRPHGIVHDRRITAEPKFASAMLRTIKCIPITHVGRQNDVGALRYYEHLLSVVPVNRALCNLFSAVRVNQPLNTQ